MLYQSQYNLCLRVGKLAAIACFLVQPIAGFLRSPSYLLSKATRTSSFSLEHTLQHTIMKASRQDTSQKHLVLIGGGHAHAQVIKALHKKARPEFVRVTLIDVLPAACYSGMVPGCIIGSYTINDTLIQLEPLANWASIDFLQGSVIDVDFDTKQIVLKDDRHVAFDVVSIDIGSTSRDLDDIPGARAFSIPTRPIHKLVQRLDDALSKQQQQQKQHHDAAPHIVIVGAGVAGIELAMAITTKWQSIFPNATCTLLDAGSTLLPSESTLVRNKVCETLRRKQISVDHNVKVKQVFADGMELQCTNSDTIKSISYSICVWATGAGPNPLATHLIEHRNLEATPQGWLTVRPTLQSMTHNFVFCAGDCASIQGLERPKAGVYAVRAGPVLIENLCNYITGDKPLIPYQPQDDFLKLMVCDEERAIGIRFGMAMEGAWVWKLKDYIDRQFMNLFDVSRLSPPSTNTLDTSQYDDDSATTLGKQERLDPKDALRMLQTIDENDNNVVNYMQAWRVLREMAKDVEYRAQVLESLSVSTAPEPNLPVER